MTLKVFFSWQSDIDNDKLNNKRFLCKCINEALKNIENKGPLKNVSFEFQESTSNIAGNPSIPRTIDKRIEDCDIFIADLSIVDSYSNIELWLRRLRNAKTKRGPNMNVYGEYNKALASHPDEQIVTIMNYLNGNPKEDNSLIPFDTRERRFPLGYLLKSNKDTVKIKKSVISQLEESIRMSAIAAIKNEESKYYPFITYNMQQKWIHDMGEFIQTDEINYYQKQIHDNTGNIRLIGMSGLGKTRIVFESFRDSSQNVNYLYCDCYTYEESLIIGTAEILFEKFKSAIIVIDNCRREILEKIILSKNRHRASNPIISIFHDLNETSISHTNRITLSKKQTKVVEGIIDRYISYYKQEQRKRLIEFSGGIPLIAHRLCKSLQEGKPLGVFDDETLLSKLLGTENNSTERKMLRSISLFDLIGVSDGVRNELLFIANNKDITPIDGSTDVIMNNFDTLIRRSIERETMERNGRFVAIRPKPIGLQLTSEWLSDCNSERLLRVVKAIQESDCAKSLTESFSQHFKYMQYDENAVLMLEKLLQPNNPFHNAEVINTELGSRLFRSFVEVNPIAVANCLWSIFCDMNTEQISMIDDGRRNLVWTFEKLCFDIRTFDKGMKLMLMFGAAENETWSNNATNEFIHLFQIYLPGTQATLSERLLILRWGIERTQYKELALKAAASALRTFPFTYISGAESQGTNQLENYQPKNWGEIFNYWNECIDMLSHEIMTDTEYSGFCRDAIVQNISGLCRLGAISLILPKVKILCNKMNNDWDEMLDSLLWIKSNIPLSKNDIVFKLNDELIEALTKKDFISRFKAIEKNDYLYGSKISFEEQTNRKRERYESLAKEYVETQMNNESILLELYQVNNAYSHPFGYTIAKLIEHNSDSLRWFIDSSIQCLHSINKINPTILFSFAKRLNNENFDYLVSSLKTDDSLSYLLFRILAEHGILLSETKLLFDLIKKDIVPVTCFLDFWRSSTVIKESTEKDIINFFENILQCSNNGLDTVITMLHDLIFFNNNRNFNGIADFIIPKLENKDIATNVFVQNNDYIEVAELLLTVCNKPDFAKFINNTIIKISQDPQHQISSDSRIERIYSVLLDKYFDEISDNLFKALISDNPYTEFSFQFLLMPNKFSNLSQKLFQKKNYDTILSFCKDNKLAQNQIMRLVPAIKDGQLSKFVLVLLDKFGDNRAMLSKLEENLMTLSTVGSVIPLYEEIRNCISNLTNHNNSTVSDWANIFGGHIESLIKNEKQRESEFKMLYG